MLEAQREQLLSEAKFKVLKYENHNGIAWNYVREFKSQVESQETVIRLGMEGCACSRRQQDPLHEELAERERDQRDTQIGGNHELEALRRDQELRVDEFAKRKMIEDQNTIEELEEINCMNDSSYFKDAESARSGQLSHVPSELAVFPLPIHAGGLLGRTRNSQPDFLLRDFDEVRRPDFILPFGGKIFQEYGADTKTSNLGTSLW